jgi:hypothetical protein
MGLSMSTLNSIEAFYQEGPVLSPGQYRLEVVTAWDDETDQAPPEATTVSANFTVGAPQAWLRARILSVTRAVVRLRI